VQQTTQLSQAYRAERGCRQLQLFRNLWRKLIAVIILALVIWTIMFLFYRFSNIGGYEQLEDMLSDYVPMTSGQIFSTITALLTVGISSVGGIVKYVLKPVFPIVYAQITGEISRDKGYWFIKYDTSDRYFARYRSPVCSIIKVSINWRGKFWVKSYDYIGTANTLKVCTDSNASTMLDYFTKPKSESVILRENAEDSQTNGVGKLLSLASMTTREPSTVLSFTKLKGKRFVHQNAIIRHIDLKHEYKEMLVPSKIIVAPIFKALGFPLWVRDNGVYRLSRGDSLISIAKNELKRT